MSAPAFESRLRVEELDEFAGTWQLLEALVFTSAIAGRVEVPAGFVTDFASVPRLPFIYLAEGGRGDKAAVVHDWLYTSQSVTRERADQVLREALLASGYSAFTAGIFYAAVRAGGSSHWKAPNQPQPMHVDAAISATQATAAAASGAA